MCIPLFSYSFDCYFQAAEKEWEEKRQNMGHYDGQEFERMLQEAEANMLRGIPNLEVPSEPEGSPAVDRASLEEVVEKNEPTAAPIEQGKRLKDKQELLRLLFGDVYT